MKRALLTLSIIAAMAMVFPTDASAQSRKSKKDLLKENQKLLERIDSLTKEMDRLKADAKLDSLAAELVDIFAENDSRSSTDLAPEDYNADVTDSLMSLWYIQRQQQQNESTSEPYDMDSIAFSSDVPDDVMIKRLENMNSFIALPFNQTVKNYIVLYSEKMPTKMSRMLGLSKYYMPIFEETFNKYNLPEELKYMAIIESALNPTAVSRAGAKGMWQFMHRAAKFYGLEINSYVDERLDPYKSADAAARYLEDSYKLFGDWNLAISSYNCGPGNVNKAIRRAGGRRDFWSVYDYLPRETRGYVPAFVGAMYAINYSKENGLYAANIQLPAQVDTFEIRRNLHFNQISEVADIPLEIIEALNPQYLKSIIPGESDKPYILRIPYNYSNSFIENEDSLYTYKASEFFGPQTVLDTAKTSSTARKTVPSSGRTIYTVKRGDTLGKIAARYHTTVTQLKRWNNLKSNTINIGKKLYIYGSAGSSTASSSSSSSGYTTYTVRSGDTLSKIASRYKGVSVNDIMRYNGIGTKIKAGQKIKIPRK